MPLTTPTIVALGSSSWAKWIDSALSAGRVRADAAWDTEFLLRTQLTQVEIGMARRISRKAARVLFRPSAELTDILPNREYLANRNTCSRGGIHLRELTGFDVVDVTVNRNRSWYQGM